MYSTDNSKIRHKVDHPIIRPIINQSETSKWSGTLGHSFKLGSFRSLSRFFEKSNPSHSRTKNKKENSNQFSQEQKD